MRNQLLLLTDFCNYLIVTETNTKHQDCIIVLLQEALVRVMSSDFKTTSCPVVLDFLIRHSMITPDSGEFIPFYLPTVDNVHFLS